jgi:hypothetical protein
VQNEVVGCISTLLLILYTGFFQPHSMVAIEPMKCGLFVLYFVGMLLLPQALPGWWDSRQTSPLHAVGLQVELPLVSFHSKASHF